MNQEFIKKLNYFYRIFPAYLGIGKSQLTFWHETSEIEEEALYKSIRAFYMTFREKARYPGPFDDNGIPLLDYRGKIGEQYNPIAIAQFGLANYNLYLHSNNTEYLEKALAQAQWLVDNLIKNDKGILVWNHDFDWEYRDTLHAPWYSGLSQGNGISLLARMFNETKDQQFYDAAEGAYISLAKSMEEGGVIAKDENGDIWIEETIVYPPTHILNGFLWALWGVWDYFLLTGDPEVESRFHLFERTLLINLDKYDVGYWSLYELAGLKLKMLASPFYHSLHCVQLRVTARMTGNAIFDEYASCWEKYRSRRLNRIRAISYKALFKLSHY